MRQLSQLVLFLLIILNGINSYSQIWSQLGSSILGDTTEDWFGYSVALDKDGVTIAIGAHHNDANGEDAGQVKTFTWDGGSWIQKGFELFGVYEGDRFGNSVALSGDGNTLASGAIFSDNNGIASGQVHVYRYAGNLWIHKGGAIDGESAGDQFGRDVALNADGTVLAASADFNDGNGDNSGHVRIYDWDGSVWIQRGNDIDGEHEYDYSGFQIDLNDAGDVVAIGASSNDDNGERAGHVRVFQWNGNNWAQKGSDIDGEAADESSGRDVVLNADGNTVAIGVPGHSGSGTDAGAVRVFTWNGSSWVQMGSTIEGEAAGDAFGYSVSLNDNGTSMVIGGLYNGDNGTNAGHVRAYHWNGSAWIQKGIDIDGDAAEDRFGISTAINGDGNIWAAGATRNSTSAFEAGQVRVYSLATGIGEENFVPAVSAYPNPTTGLLTIDLDQTYSEITLSISNLLGQLLFTHSFQGVDKIEAQLSGSSGFYLVSVVTPEGKGATLKVLKE